MIFNDVYKDKRVLVTGHTGFKGSWLAIWLNMLGAKVIGYSLYLPSDPCNFQVCNLENKMTHIIGDIRDREKLKMVFMQHKPEIVFHLAAQPLVRKSYNDPILTYETNIMGTINVLECIRTIPDIAAAIIITSDKCYHNVEWIWGYRENDRLGGEDPYSSSKACAEIVTHAYIKSFFSNETKTKIATTRAGNVIGGGDWAQDRILPDCVRAISGGNPLKIRSPKSTRPWQHVLEPLSGYLLLGSEIFQSDKLHSEAFNFGPDQRVNKSVQELIELFIKFWGEGGWDYIQSDNEKKESNLLKLSCDKALHYLNWHALLSFKDTVRLTAEWYKTYYNKKEDMYNFTVKQIEYYISEAIKNKMLWVKGTSK